MNRKEAKGAKKARRGNKGSVDGLRDCVSTMSGPEYARVRRGVDSIGIGLGYFVPGGDVRFAGAPSASAALRQLPHG